MASSSVYGSCLEEMRAMTGGWTKDMEDADLLGVDERNSYVVFFDTDFHAYFDSIVAKEYGCTVQRLYDTKRSLFAGLWSGDFCFDKMYFRYTVLHSLCDGQSRYKSHANAVLCKARKKAYGDFSYSAKFLGWCSQFVLPYYFYRRDEKRKVRVISYLMEDAKFCGINYGVEAAVVPIAVKYSTPIFKVALKGILIRSIEKKEREFIIGDLVESEFPLLVGEKYTRMCVRVLHCLLQHKKMDISQCFKLEKPCAPHDEGPFQNICYGNTVLVNDQRYVQACSNIRRREKEILNSKEIQCWMMEDGNVLDHLKQVHKPDTDVVTLLDRIGKSGKDLSCYEGDLTFNNQGMDWEEFYCLSINCYRVGFDADSNKIYFLKFSAVDNTSSARVNANLLAEYEYSLVFGDAKDYAGFLWKLFRKRGYCYNREWQLGEYDGDFQRRTDASVYASARMRIPFDVVTNDLHYQIDRRCNRVWCVTSSDFLYAEYKESLPPDNEIDNQFGWMIDIDPGIYEILNPNDFAPGEMLCFCRSDGAKGITDRHSDQFYCCCDFRTNDIYQILYHFGTCLLNKTGSGVVHLPDSLEERSYYETVANPSICIKEYFCDQCKRACRNLIEHERSCQLE